MRVEKNSGMKSLEIFNNNKRKLFFVPGVSQVSTKAGKKVYRGSIFHRSRDFIQLYKIIEEKLKRIFKTNNRILVITSSGTGGMEACVCNFVNNNDCVLVIEGGKYGKRWTEILRSYNISPLRLELEWGKNISPEFLEKYLKKIDNLDVVFLTHCETSTGILFDIETITRTIKKFFKCIIIVDAISTLGTTELNTDEWDLDVVVSVSQKGLLGPSGLSFLSVNYRALEKLKTGNLPKYYFDLKKYLEYAEKRQTPFTPGSIQLLYLKESLDFIEMFGIENVFGEIEKFASKFRDGLSKLGYTFFPESPASCITVINVRKKPEEFINVLNEKHNVIVANGQGILKDRVVRVSHIGLFTETQIEYLIDLFNKYRNLLI